MPQTQVFTNFKIWLFKFTRHFQVRKNMFYHETLLIKTLIAGILMAVLFEIKKITTQIYLHFSFLEITLEKKSWILEKNCDILAVVRRRRRNSKKKHITLSPILFSVQRIHFFFVMFRISEKMSYEELGISFVNLPFPALINRITQPVCIFQQIFTVQCNLDLVTLNSTKTVTKLHNVTKSNDFIW